MISLTNLLETTSHLRPRVMTYGKNTDSFNNLELLEKNQKAFDNSVIYVGYTSNAKNLSDTAKNAALLLVNDCTIPYNSFFDKDNTIIEYPPYTDLFNLFNTVKSMLFKEWDLLKSSSHLLNAVLKNNSVDELVETAATLTNCHIMVMDVSFKVVSYSKSIRVEDTIQNQILETGGFSYEYITAINQFYLKHNIPKNNTPYYLSTGMSPARRLVSKIYHQGTHLGFLVALEGDKSFEKIDFELFRRISDAFAKFIKSNSSVHKTYSTFEPVLLDLLEGNIDNPTIFLQSVKDLNLEHNANYQVVNIDLSHYEHTDTSNQFLKLSINNMFKKSWSFYYRGSIVVLVKIKDKGGLASFESHSLNDLCQDKQLRAGISTVFENLYYFPLQYKQAVNALTISGLLNSEDYCSMYENCKFFDLISAAKHGNPSTDDNDLLDYCSTKLLTIQKHDEEFATDYLNTLWTYLNCNKNHIKTASELFVHKNTVAYRLQKFKELFNLDIEDDYQLFQFYYSYLLVKFVKSEEI